MDLSSLFSLTLFPRSVVLLLMSKRPLVIDLVGDSSVSDSSSDDDEEAVAPEAPVLSVSVYPLLHAAKVPVSKIPRAVEEYYLLNHIPTDLHRDLFPRLGTLGPVLYQAPSAIEGAGNGLFAPVPIQRGEIITYYDGIRVTEAAHARLSAQEGMRSAAAAYTQALEPGYQVIMGNVTYRDPARHGRVFQINQKAPENDETLLRFLEPEEISSVFTRHGAGHLLNTTKDSKDKRINTRVLTLQDSRRFTSRELQRSAFERDYPRTNATLQRQYPEAVLSVFYATRDIPANTELLWYYGKKYVDANLGAELNEEVSF